MIARPSLSFVALLLASTACSVDGGDHDSLSAQHAVATPATPNAASAPAASARAVAPEAVAQQPAAAASKSSSASPAQPAVQRAKSSWTPDVLDTGVDLSSVRVGTGPQAPAPATPAATAVQPALPTPVPPPFQGPTTTYSGGLPDLEKYASGPEPVGFLSVAEAAAIHDFGPLTQGAKVSHTFELETSGDAPVVVREIKTSCGCTVAMTEVVTAEGKAPYDFGTPLEAGSKLHVSAQLDTRAKSGAVRSVVTVVANDPRGQMQLQLSASVMPFFEVEPRIINFGSLRSDAVVEQELVITSPVAQRYKLSVMDAGMPSELSVTLTPEDPDADGRAAKWRALVKLGPNIPDSGRKNYQVLFTSDQPIDNGLLGPDGEPQMQSVHVYTMADVLGLLSATPAYFTFGLMQPGQSIARTTRVDNNDAEFTMAPPSVSLRGYQGDFEYPDNVSFEVVTVTEGKSYDIVMTMRAPEGLTGTFRGQLILGLGHPSKPTFEIPFTGVVRNTAPTPPPKPVDGHDEHDGHGHDGQ